MFITMLKSLLKKYQDIEISQMSDNELFYIYWFIYP